MQIFPAGVEFNVTLVSTSANVDEWKFQVAMAVINHSEDLANHNNWRWVKGVGRPLQFRFNRKNLDKLAVGGDLKMLVWISQVGLVKCSTTMASYRCLV